MSHPSDQDLDLSVAAMLRIGVSVAALVVLVGGCVLLARSWSSVPAYRQFHPADPALTTFSGIVRGVRRFDSRSVIQLGLVLLILTPVARVVLCVVGFARQRDKLYVAISCLVLAVLLYSLAKGHAG